MFTLLLTSIAVLSFSIEFENKFNDERQDYFFFEGKNQSAHLSRVNNTLTLFLYKSGNFSIYRSSIESGNLTFSWSSFRVNEEKMNLEKSVGEISNLHFENFTLLSPLITFSNKEPTPIQVLNCTDGSINYWYILLMIVMSGVLFESKTHGAQMIKRLLNRYSSVQTNDDVDENLKSTQV